MDEEKFLKRELNIRVIIDNLNSNLTYGAIIRLLRKYKERHLNKDLRRGQAGSIDDKDTGKPKG